MNAHCCNLQHRNAEYNRAVNEADMLLPDGIGVELAGRMRGQQLTANLNGTDFVPQLLAEAAKLGKSVFLFGGKPGHPRSGGADADRKDTRPENRRNARRV